MSQDFWDMKLCPGVSGAGCFIFQFQGVQEEEEIFVFSEHPFYSDTPPFLNVAGRLSVPTDNSYTQHYLYSTKIK
jgi:hypothetical protein